MPVGYNINFIKDKQVDGFRCGRFSGIFSHQEEDNVIGVIDLAFEAERMAMDGYNSKGSSLSAPVKQIDVPITFDDGDDLFIDFDA